MGDPSFEDVLLVAARHFGAFANDAKSRTVPAYVFENEQLGHNLRDIAALYFKEHPERATNLLASLFCLYVNAIGGTGVDAIIRPVNNDPDGLKHDEDTELPGD